MADRAARFAAALAALWAAHDVADHVVQTDHQAATKATSWRGMAGHVGTYHAAQVGALAVLRALGVRPSWRRTLAAVAWSAGTHALLDRRWPVTRILRATGSPRFSRPQIVVGPTDGDTMAGPLPLHGPYLADQALHHGALFIAALLLATGRDRGRQGDP